MRITSLVGLFGKVGARFPLYFVLSVSVTHHTHTHTHTQTFPHSRVAMPRGRKKQVGKKGEESKGQEQQAKREATDSSEPKTDADKESTKAIEEAEGTN